MNMATDPIVGQQFRIIDNGEADAIVNTFAGMPDGFAIPVLNQGTGDPLLLQITYSGGDVNNNDVVLTRVVPEPGSLGLAALAGMGLAMRRRRRSRD
jgi:hypothetical protein